MRPKMVMETTKERRAVSWLSCDAKTHKCMLSTHVHREQEIGTMSSGGPGELNDVMSL
jgi:hypothetical protein